VAAPARAWGRSSAASPGRHTWWPDPGTLLTGAVTLPGGTARARVVFDSVGIAFVDTAVAALLLSKAEAGRLGIPFDFTPPA
jgi:hypothetical protein